jgi:hypothetical protein
LDTESAKQLAVRLLFVAYGVAVYIRLRAQSSISAAASNGAFWTLRILLAYGVYEVFAKFFGWPLFLTFLLNNPSYSNALEVTSEMSGWALFFRAQSIWPEPSFAILPIALFFVLSDGEGRGIGKMDFTLIVLFAIATFSRSVWIGLAVILFARLKFARKRQVFLSIGVAIIFTIGMLNVKEDADWSASVRTATALQGFQIANENFFKGIGFNKFKDTSLAAVTGESVVHNTFSNYIASMGWPIGFSLFLALLFPLVRVRDGPLGYLLPLSVVLVFSVSDMFYFTTLFFLAAYAQAKGFSPRSLVS